MFPLFIRFFLLINHVVLYSKQVFMLQPKTCFGKVLNIPYNSFFTELLNISFYTFLPCKCQKSSFFAETINSSQLSV